MAGGHVMHSADKVVTISPHDTNSFTATKGLYVGTAGALKFTDTKGNDITYATAVTGYHPIKVTRVFNIGTDAADIHGLY